MPRLNSVPETLRQAVDSDSISALKELIKNYFRYCNTNYFCKAYIQCLFLTPCLLLFSARWILRKSYNPRLLRFLYSAAISPTLSLEIKLSSLQEDISYMFVRNALITKAYLLFANLRTSSLESFPVRGAFQLSHGVNSVFDHSGFLSSRQT